VFGSPFRAERPQSALMSATWESRVRLLRIQIKEFRSIYQQSLPADGLVVLFGPNSAGKTSVLEAATELIRTSATHRSDPGELDEVYAVGSLWFSLPGAVSA
jgi:recombinational DNA repair ATPase RecF